MLDDLMLKAGFSYFYLKETYTLSTDIKEMLVKTLVNRQSNRGDELASETEILKGTLVMKGKWWGE